MGYQGKYSNSAKKAKLNAITKLITLSTVVVLAVMSLWIYLTVGKDEVSDTQKFTEIYTSAISVKDIKWPESDTEGNAQVIVAVPNLTLAHQMATNDPKNNGKNTIELLGEYIQDSCTDIQIDIQAYKNGKDWILDSEQLDQIIAEYQVNSIDSFLSLAFSELDTIEINISMEEQ